MIAYSELRVIPVADSVLTCCNLFHALCVSSLASRSALKIPLGLLEPSPDTNAVSSLSAKLIARSRAKPSSKLYQVSARKFCVYCGNAYNSPTVAVITSYSCASVAVREPVSPIQPEVIPANPK